MGHTTGGKPNMSPTYSQVTGMLCYYKWSKQGQTSQETKFQGQNTAHEIPAFYFIYIFTFEWQLGHALLWNSCPQCLRWLRQAHFGAKLHIKAHNMRVY